MSCSSEEEFQSELKLLQEYGIKNSTLRTEYEQKVRDLAAERDVLLKSGIPLEQAARLLHEHRRQLGREYKDAAPPLFREYIFFATERKYGDPLGPSYEVLSRTKTPEEILESASRPIPDLNDRLTSDGFINWFYNIHQK